jgi:malate dehydrogenase (oxaloacetate-decarboxylating)(NADP+)
MAMISYSNFGTGAEEECRNVRGVVEKMHQLYPKLLIDGEMNIAYALNKGLRDETFPFNRLNGKEVNTLIFPNLSTANTAYKLMLQMGMGNSIGPIQMGLNKPVHFTNVNAPVRDIVTLATIAGLDAAVMETGKGSSDK